jgi:hypothetical protein
MEAAQRLSARAIQQVQRDSPCRQASTCGDYLAGIAGGMGHAHGAIHCD